MGLAPVAERDLDALERPTGVRSGRWPWLLVVAGLIAMVGLAVHGYTAYATIARLNANSKLETPNPVVMFQDLATNGPKVGSGVESSSVFLTPPVVTDLAKHPAVGGYDLSSLRSILCAAAPLGAEMEQMAADRLGCVVRQGYGITEASGPVSTNMVEEDGRVNRRGSAGQLVPSTECKVVDLASGEELPAGESGELVVRGPQVMHGYLNKVDATAISLEPDGWLHTGDVGYTDAAGYLYIRDRVKEIIKYKAYQVAPAELEAILTAHEAVLDAAVVPVPDAESGELPKALVVLRHGDSASRTPTADELMAYVAERVAPYKKVRRLEFVESIPRSASGKILRRVLIERERAASQR